MGKTKKGNPLFCRYAKPIIAIPLALLAILLTCANHYGWDFGKIFYIWFVISFLIFSALYVITTYPCNPILLIALSRAIETYSHRLIRAYHQSKPIDPAWEEKQTWERLTAAALKGLTSEDDSTQKGEELETFVFCNFKAYAYAVTQVLKSLEHMMHEFKFENSYPRVLTVLKKPICEWYNTFPLDWSTERKSFTTYRTFEWWENYKKKIASLRESRTGIRFYRIVAHINHQNSPDHSGEYYLFSDKALQLDVAIERAKSLKSLHNIDWHPLIKPFIEDDISQDLLLNPDIKLYLIGRPLDEYSRPDIARNVIRSFERTYHNYQGRDNEGRPGLHVGYIDDPAHLEKELLAYNDVFIVRLSENRAFGLAFLDEKLRDINGMLILPEAELKQTGDDITRPLLAQFLAAWKNVKPNFTVSEPIKPEDGGQFMSATDKR